MGYTIMQSCHHKDMIHVWGDPIRKLETTVVLCFYGNQAGHAVLQQCWERKY
jgi:hypothetical protein